MMKKYKIIANPVAGSGAGARAIPRIIQLFKDHLLDFDLELTQHPGHGIELTEAAVDQGYEVIIAAGGDGTANEVINGLMNSKNAGKVPPILGLLGTGRGNDLPHGMNVPGVLEEAVAVIAKGHHNRVDIGRVVGGRFPQGRYFGNCVGIGFDAVTTIEVAKMPRLGGFFSFLIAILKTIFLYYKGPLIKVNYDGQELIQHCLMVSIMNGQRLGGGFWTAPEAKPDDGILDLCIAREVTRRRILTLIPYFMKGTQNTQPEITMGRAAQITILALDGVLPAQTDGEILCTDGNQLEIEIHPKQLEVICSP